MDEAVAGAADAGGHYLSGKLYGIVAIVVMGLYLIIIPVMIFGIVGAASAVSS